MNQPQSNKFYDNPVTQKDILTLVERAKAAKQPELECILTTVLASMQGNQLPELQGVFRDFSIKKIKEYEKVTGRRILGNV